VCVCVCVCVCDGMRVDLLDVGQVERVAGLARGRVFVTFFHSISGLVVLKFV